MLTIIKNISQVLTMSGVVKKRGISPKSSDLGIIENGAIIHDKNSVLWVGKDSDVPNEYLTQEGVKIIDGNNKCYLPQLIDCHTHIVFAGFRANELTMKYEGLSYAEISKRGGGILSTVMATREASFESLYDSAFKRLDDFQKLGVYTVEIKSGYGLDLESEIKILRVIKKLRAEHSSDIISTFLGAHAIPPEFKDKRGNYIELICNEMLPIIKEENLAEFCDVFMDEGYFTWKETELIFKAALDNGLKLKLHADEIADTGAAALAANFKVQSVDHLLKTNNHSIKKMVESEIVGVLLPGTSFFIKENHANARMLIDSGVPIALSTDFNPGSSPTGNLPLIMTIAFLYMNMSPAECITGVTYNAARAIDRHEKKGAILPGFEPIFAVLNSPVYEDLIYNFGRVGL